MSEDEEMARREVTLCEQWHVKPCESQMCRLARALLRQREEMPLLRAVLTQARLTLLTSIKKPELLPESLGSLNLKCKACWDYETERIKQAEALQSSGRGKG